MDILPDFPQAACKGRADIYEARNRESEAQTLCRHCAHQEDCLIWALRHQHDDIRRGYHSPVWGGFTDRQRVELRADIGLRNPPIDLVRACGHLNQPGSNGGLCASCRETYKRGHDRRQQRWKTWREQQSQAS